MDMKFDKVIKNEYGFYELKQKPVEEEQKRIFENEFYQEGQGNYETQYPDEAIKYFMNKAEQKEIAIRKIMDKTTSIVGGGAGYSILAVEKASY